VIRALSQTAFIVLVSTSAHATDYSAKAINARVVDAGTAMPLEGVHVVVEWSLVDGSGGKTGSLELREAVTDQNGRFQVDAWGPRTVSEDYLPGNRPGTRIPPEDPHFTLFKSGYQVLALGETASTEYLSDPTWKGASIRGSYWDGRTIELRMFRGDAREYANQAQVALVGIDYQRNCNWKNIPMMLVALIKDGDRLTELGVQNYVSPLDKLERAADRWKCGPVSSFLEGYSK